jgi:hypothetical protein
MTAHVHTPKANRPCFESFGTKTSRLGIRPCPSFVQVSSLKRANWSKAANVLFSGPYAIQRDIPLVTADRKLWSAVRSRRKLASRVRLLEELPLE